LGLGPATPLLSIPADEMVDASLTEIRAKQLMEIDVLHKILDAAHKTAVDSASQRRQLSRKRHVKQRDTEQINFEI
jgi:hypothetical protein